LATIDQTELSSRLSALLRFLLCRSPSVAESRWAFSQSHPPFPVNRWIEIRHPLKTGWIKLDDHRNGLHSAVRPSNVTDTDMLVFVVPPGPSFQLRTQFSSLIPLIQQPEARRQFEDILPLLLDMGNGSFELREMEYFLDECFNAFERGQSAPVPDEPIISFLNKYADDLCNRYLHQKAPGYFVGLIQLLVLAWNRVSFFSPLWPRWENGQAPPIILLSLMKYVFAEIEGGIGWQEIDNAAREMYKRGSDLQDKALEAQGDDEFYGRLYESCSWLYGAAEGFSYLSKNTTLNPDERKEINNLLKMSRELGVMATTSLLSDCKNRLTGGAQLQADRKRILQVKQTKGLAAAEDLVTQLLEIELMYPASYHDQLNPPQEQ
jgi:hypothetical protein